MNVEPSLYNFIGGERRLPIGGEYLTRHEPATGEAVTNVPDSDLVDLALSLKAANSAFTLWGALSRSERATLLLKAAEILSAHAPELAALDSRLTGQPLAEANAVTAPAAAEEFRRHAHRLFANPQKAPDRITQAPSGGEEVSFSRLHPVGLVGLILPWSAPTFELARKLAPALAAGCCVIIKPTSLAPASALRMAELLHISGFPPGTVNVVCGRGESIGEAMAMHPGISTLSLTGSLQTARLVQASTASAPGTLLKKWQMSLGGRNAVLVFGDVNIEKAAVDVAELCFPFHARTADRGSRLFIQESIYKPFLDALARAVTEKLSVGAPEDPQTRIGPLPSAELMGRFESACEQARAEKGKPLLGRATGRAREGWFVEPEIFYDLTLCSTLQQEEVIGPFVTASSFKYQHDAIKQANASPYGKTSYVFTSELARALKVSVKLEAGTVEVNPTRVSTTGLATTAPGSAAMRAIGAGNKNSGLGADGGEELFEFFQKPSRVRILS